MSGFTRREFLGASATLAAAGCAGLPSAAPAPIPVTGLNHMTLMVSDVDRSLAFYQELFGMPVQAWQGDTPCLRIGEGPAFMALARARSGVPTGIHHLCLTVPGFDATALLARLDAHGVAAAPPGATRLTGGPLHARVRLRGERDGGAPGGTPELYLGDRDGIVVQLQDERYCGGAGALGERCAAKVEPSPHPGRMALRGINHFTIFARDASASLAFYQRVFDMEIRKTQGSMPLLDAGDGTQILGFVGTPEMQLPPMIHHACVTLDDFQHERVLGLLEAQGLTLRPDPEGRPIPPLSAYVTQRMPDRGGAPGGTPELYFSDPDGILIQIQDTRYCGGSGYLGEVCAYL